MWAMRVSEAVGSIFARQLKGQRTTKHLALQDPAALLPGPPRAVSCLAQLCHKRTSCSAPCTHITASTSSSFISSASSSA